MFSKGFNIIGSAEDGNAAYNLIVKLKPEIAILDIRMPHKSGLEIAEACKKNNLKKIFCRSKFVHRNVYFENFHLFF